MSFLRQPAPVGLLSETRNQSTRTSGGAGNRATVARDAHRGVFGPDASRVEARSVWVESESTANGGVAHDAIALAMARRARFETLPCRLSVSEAESPECIVVARRANAPRRHHPALLVAALAELRRVVAIGAVRLARVGSARVPREERRGVVA